MSATAAVLLCVGIVLAGTVLGGIIMASGTWISAAAATTLTMLFVVGLMLVGAGIGVWIFGIDSNWVLPFPLVGFFGGLAVLWPR